MSQTNLRKLFDYVVAWVMCVQMFRCSAFRKNSAFQQKRWIVIANMFTTQAFDRNQAIYAC